MTFWKFTLFVVYALIISRHLVAKMFCLLLSALKNYFCRNLIHLDTKELENSNFPSCCRVSAPNLQRHPRKLNKDGNPVVPSMDAEKTSDLKRDSKV